jgi:hypothetical protein
MRSTRIERTMCRGHNIWPDRYAPGSPTHNVSAEALCAEFHKSSPRKRARLPRIGRITRCCGSVSLTREQLSHVQVVDMVGAFARLNQHAARQDPDSSSASAVRRRRQVGPCGTAGPLTPRVACHSPQHPSISTHAHHDAHPRPASPSRRAGRRTHSHI